MTTAVSEVSLEAGEVLFYQGDESRDFFVLREGAVEILVSETERLRGEALLDASRRVAVLDTPGAPIGEIGAILDEPRTATVRAVRPSNLLRVPAHGRAFRSWLAENPTLARVIARSLVERIGRTEMQVSEARALEADAARLADGMAYLLLLFLEAHSIPPPEGFDAVWKRAQEVRAAARREGLEPAHPTLAVLARSYRPPETREAGGALDAELVRFLSALVRHPASEAFFEQDPAYVLFVIDRLAAVFPLLNARLRGAGRTLDRLVAALLGSDDSIAAAAVACARAVREPRAAGEFRTICERFRTEVEELRGRMVEWMGCFPPAADRAIAALAEAVERAKQGEAEAVVVRAAMPEGPREAKVLSAILRLDIPSAVKERFPKALSAAVEGDADAGRLVTKLYWQIVPEVFRALLSERRDEWLWFLRWGLAFDGVLEPERAEKVPTAPGKPGPVMYLDDWLGKIYRGEIGPSRNDLGQTYDEVVRDRPGGRWCETEHDPSMDLVRYECEAVLFAASRAISGGRATAVPVIPEPALLDGEITQPATVAKIVVEILSIDFSAFYREVRALVGERSEFVPKEVVPRFLILPAAGSRGVPWQEFEGKAKDTPGRIFLPVRPEGDLRDLLIETIGRFRWLLARAIAGYAWADPVEGGLTGKYMDYIQFYKKNPNLSDEQKAKITEEWRSLTMDVDKFVRDYFLWIKYESQGIQRLNRVVRALFVDMIPFSKPIRERLTKSPVFQELLAKDSNRRLKKRLEIVRRIQAYENKGVDARPVFETALRLYEPLSDS